MKNIAIITARSGSKGIPDKNIKELNGKPLMAYSIEAAKESQMFDEIMVSTDSNKYANIAKEYGASVPFLRDEINSMDGSSSWDVINEVLANYDKHGREFDTFCLLQPTSPLRSAEDIVDAYRLLTEKKGFAVVSVCELEHPVEWCGQIPDDLSMESFQNQKVLSQRQKFSPVYRINGAIYISDIHEFNTDNNLYRNGCYAYIMNRLRSVDIDNELDFALAELYLRSGLL